MFTIAIIGQKGGTGKTVTAIGLAVASTRAGFATVLVDLDPQATASKWKDRRTDENPAVVSAQASRLGPVLDASRRADIDLAIIDTAGRSDDSALNAARAADLVLIPCRPNMVEIETLSAVKDLLMLAGNPLAFVLLNGIHPTATKQADETRDMVQQAFGLQSCPVHLCHRSAYAEAPTAGKTPQELDPEGKAAIELQRLFEFTCEIVKLGKGEQHGESLSHSGAA
jgi:chromosome partitioning protein